MTYSIIGILAAIILLIIYRDVLWNREDGQSTTLRNYRHFLLGVMAYYVTDALWGILDSWRWTGVQFADTAVHFLAMVASVMLWTRYAVSYLESDNRFGRFLQLSGRVFLAFEIAVVAVNFFRPVLFWFDESGGYHASAAR